MGGFSLYSFLVNFLSSAHCAFYSFILDDTFYCCTLETLLRFIILTERKQIIKSVTVVHFHYPDITQYCRIVPPQRRHFGKHNDYECWLF